MAKAGNKKKKRLSRGGRPMDAGCKRTPSGQKSRAKEAQDQNTKQIKETVVQQRIRLAAVDGVVLSEQEAESPHWGYAAGRKYFAGDLGKVGSQEALTRLQTGNDVACTWMRCRALMGYPPLTSQAANMGRVRGLAVEGMNAQWAGREAANTVMRFEGILGSAGQGCRTAFKEVFLSEEPATEAWPDHMNHLLCKALDALGRG